MLINIVKESVIRYLSPDFQGRRDKEHEWYHQADGSHPGEHWKYRGNTSNPEVWMRYIMYGVAKLTKPAYCTDGQIYKGAYAIWITQFPRYQSDEIPVIIHRSKAMKKEWVVITSPQDSEELIQNLKADSTPGTEVEYDMTMECDENPWVLIIDHKPEDNKISLYPLDAIAHDPSIANALTSDGALDFG
jgi:hypothetical protein